MNSSNHIVTKKRPPSRGKISRPERAAQSRERILKAAIILFARSGYDGASVDEIVARAGINKRMVYHYFGSKDGLYAATLTRMYEGLAAVELDVLRDNPTAFEAIERIVRAYFKFLQDTPEFVSLLLWENLQGGRHLGNIGDSVTKAPILDALDSVIARGIASGELRAGIDRRHLLINLIGLSLIYFSNRHTLAKSVGLDLASSDVIEDGITHAIALARFGCVER